jgi:hypothetical protein
MLLLLIMLLRTYFVVYLIKQIKRIREDGAVNQNERKISFSDDLMVLLYDYTTIKQQILLSIKARTSL